MTNPPFPLNAVSPLQVSTQRTTAVAGNAATLAGTTIAARAQVRTAPESLKPENTRVRVEGRVVSSNPQTRELRVATKEGDVVIDSDAAIPSDTDVALDLITQKTETLAAITILRKQEEVAKELQDAIDKAQAAPPLKEGDKVVALQLPEEDQPPAAPLSLQEAAKIIEQIKSSSTQSLPPNIPLPPAVLIALAKSKDVLATLQKLPIDQQQSITQFLQRLQTVAPAAAAPVQETIDKSLLNIVQAQVTAKLSQETAAPTVLPAQETAAKENLLQGQALSVLNTLLPFFQNADSATDTIPAFIKQFVPAQVVSQLQQSDITQKNFFQLTIQKILPPNTPAAQIPLTAQNGPSQSGTVEALTQSGLPVIRTQNNGTLVLRTPTAVEVGSTVIFQAQQLSIDQVIAQSRMMPLAAPSTAAFDPLTDNTWPALQEAVQALSQTQSIAAANLKNTLPSATPKFTPTALFFLAALRSGGVESWLGSGALQTLKDIGKRDLAEKLGGDFGKISAQSKESLNGEWRMISMPMLHDEQLTQLQFFIRHQNERESGDDGEKKTVTRFILNLQLSRMGDMQLDGLLRKKQFDIILRSTDQLPFDMRQDLMKAFAKGLEQANMQGGIGFQVKRDHWVNVELPKHGETVA